MSVLEKLTIAVEMDGKNAERGLDSLGTKSGGLGTKLAGLGKVAAVGLAAGLGLAAAAAYNMIGPMASMEQNVAKANTVFGDSVGSVNTWATATANGMGLTKNQAVGLAASFGDLLVPMGFTRQQAAAMSTDVVGLSGALSAWTGGTRSAAEVSDILAAAMLGERDALKGLGISITEADVAARLLANGTSELTGLQLQQATATATQQLIFEKSADAQAAFADGQKTIGERMLEVNARMGEVKDSLLTALMPAFSTMLDWVVAHMPEIQSGIDTALRVAGEAMNWIKDDVIPPLVEAFRKIRTWVDDNKEEIKAFFSQVKETASTMYEFIVGTLVPVVIEKLTKLYSDSKEPMANMKQMFDTIVSAVGKVVAALGGGSEFAGLGKLVSIAVDGILMPLRTLITVANAVATAFNLAVSAIERLNRTGVNKTPGPSGTGLGGARGPAPKKQLQGFALGGMVPGTGPQLAVVHGGERILTPQQQRTWNMGGITIYIQGGPTAEATADRVVSRIAALGIA